MQVSGATWFRMRTVQQPSLAKIAGKTNFLAQDPRSPMVRAALMAPMYPLRSFVGLTGLIKFVMMVRISDPWRASYAEALRTGICQHHNAENSWYYAIPPTSWLESVEKINDKPR